MQALDDALSAVEGVTAVTTLTYDPLYLADGLQVPTGRGFYVHREERYRPEDAPEAVRLSRAAWETWEPAWGTVVTGVFQERGEPADVARLVRIVWYRDFQHWVTIRQGEPESRRSSEREASCNWRGRESPSRLIASYDRRGSSRCGHAPCSIEASFTSTRVQHVAQPEACERLVTPSNHPGRS